MTCEMELSRLTNDPRMQCLDPDLLRAFVIIADTRSFTRAAERLLRTQPAISLQMKRLEEAVGRSLLKRNPRLVRLTPAGEVLLDYARRILALNDDLLARVKEPDLVGTVRLGTPEDFATMHLSGVLARFSQAYPGVALEVTCDLTLNLIERFRQGSFDLALIMREPSLVNGGMRVWREPLVWVTATNLPLAKENVLPLVVAPAPCVYRRRAIGVLDKAGIAWRIAYTCSSLAGSLAAVRAGLGTTVLPRGMVPGDLQMIDGETLPDLKEAEFALLVGSPLSPPAERLQSQITRALEIGGLDQN
jgi:DNA-binding transcriptional LysR family regulator